MLENEINKINEDEEASGTVTGVDETVSEEHPNETPEESAEIPHFEKSEDDNHAHEGHGSGEQDTFPRSYVEKLRKSEAKYRERAGQADALAQRLHTALVAADGRLADPEDLEFAPEHLDDADALAAAISELVERKPGLKAQRVSGDVGQGQRGSKPAPSMDLLSIMKGM